MESFEVNGKWWFPNSDKEPRPGMLVFEPAVSGRLIAGDRDFYGWIGGQRDEDGRIPLILGDLDDGTPVTLLNCKPGNVWLGNTREAYEQDSLWLFCEAIFVGCHFGTVDDIAFEIVSTRYTYLDNWITAPSKAEYRAWTDSIQSSGDSTHSLNFADYDTLEPIEVNLNEGRMSVWTEHINSVEDTDDFTNLSKRISLRLNDRCYSNYSTFLRVYLRNFLTLATNRRNYPLDIVGHRHALDSVPIRIYFRVSGYRNRNEIPPSVLMIFNYRDLNSQLGADDASKMLESYMQRWIDSHQNIEKVHNILFTVFHQENIDTVVHFLLLTQALEAYHRGRLPGEYLAEIDYQPLWHLLKQAIDSTVPQHLADTIDTLPHLDSGSRLQMLKSLQDSNQGEPLRQKLKSSIAYSYEFSLIKRLTELRKLVIRSTSKDLFMRILKMSPSVNSGDFESKVKDTRNYYTHRLADRTNIIEEAKLPNYVERIQFLLQVILLIDMEFPASKVAELLEDHLNRYISKP